MYNLWIWDGGSWRVIASYPTNAEARAAGKHSADPTDTWCVARAGGIRDEYLRQHCTERMANAS